MTDKGLLADRLVARRTDATADPVEVEDLGCYGLVRGIRDRCPMIDFVQPNGDSCAYAYADLTRVVWTRARQLELVFTHAVVKVTGQNLTHVPAGVSLHAGLKLHRVPWVKAVDELRGKVTNPDAALVTRIVIDGQTTPD